MNSSEQTDANRDAASKEALQARAQQIYDTTVSEFREKKRGTIPDRTLEARVHRGEEQWNIITRLSWMADVDLPAMDRLRFLDIGSGADESPDSSPPLLCRFLASKGAELVIGIDQAENDPFTEDVYAHVAIELHPETNLPAILRGKQLDRLNLIVTHMFIDPANPSPTMKDDRNDMESAVLEWADRLLVPGGVLMLLQIDAKVYVKNEEGLMLKHEL